MTEHSFLPSRLSGPVMSESTETSRSWPAMKYGPANVTFSARSSVIEYVATTSLTWSVWMSVSRWALGAWTHSIASAE